MKAAKRRGKVVGASFVFQFSTSLPPAQLIHCMADAACPYPATIGNICRLHYLDYWSPISLTKTRPDKISWDNISQVNELIEFWKEWIKEFRSYSGFVYSMCGVTGLDHPQAKLSDEQVQEIRRELRHERDFGLLGEKYGVTHSEISMIAKGRGFRGITGQDLGWTSDERSECSKRVAAARWAVWKENNKGRMEERLRATHEMRQQGLSWREIERKLGISYVELSRKYRAAYGLHALSHRQAGLKRKKQMDITAGITPEYLESKRVDFSDSSTSPQ